jgi:hypothetical protein
MATYAKNTQVIIRWADESTYGSVNGTPTMSNIPFLAGESLKGDEDIEPSNVIRDDRMKDPGRRTGEGASGSIPVPLRYSDFDEWLGYVIFDSAWSSETTVVSATACSITASTGTFAIDDGTWTNTPTVGSIVKVTGSANSDTNTYYKIATSSSSEFTVDNKDDLTDEAGVSLTITELAQVTNGTSLNTIDIEREHNGITKFELYSGLGIDGFSMSIPEQGYITCSFDFVGQQEEANDATVGDGSPNSMSTNDDMIESDVKYLLDAYSSVNVRSMNLNISNSLGGKQKVGQINPFGLDYARIEITGDMEVYFSDHTIKDKFVAGTASNLLFAIEDSDGNAYVFDLPNIKYTDDDTNNDSEEGDVMENVSFEGYADTTEEVAIRIAKYTSS